MGKEWRALLTADMILPGAPRELIRGAFLLTSSGDVEMRKILIVGGLVIVLAAVFAVHEALTATTMKPTPPLEVNLAIGQKAPDFSLPSSTAATIRLSEFEGRDNLVLYFYPKDMSPVCTTEACSFRDLNGKFKAINAVILGVSNDDLASHAKFTAAEHLNFPLSSDTSAAVSREYGVYKPMMRNGIPTMGIERTTFVIGRHGVIRAIYRNMDIETHADEVFHFVRALPE